MKNNLEQSSDFYYHNAEQIVMSVLEQCNTSKAEVEKLNLQLNQYISSVNGGADVLGGHIVLTGIDLACAVDGGKQAAKFQREKPYSKHEKITITDNSGRTYTPVDKDNYL